ncbi:uncharacterized protein N7496_001311 [Penicillium cataractarum]|uniref:Zn(2)-C6 fungal-type domain-containing protein n=1 Tax=Penicillium cataractarum TaxID=2100454 RepID=A0A9X0B6S8_9EURO|nr:uncharacterized protein N7496_001311 [Penicillium cataractarum]KAJ5390243.1 hypothetical protein N7496_001311 [Penicillium cataractarum]
MKRKNRGNPIATIHRWNKPPLSCRECREKKRRCDRAQPCSNCVIRKISCEYPGQSPEDVPVTEALMESTSFHSNKNAADRDSAHTELAANNTDELLFRIRRLEEALAKRSNTSPEPAGKRQCVYPPKDLASNSPYVTPFSCHLLAALDKYEEGPTIFDYARKLPPLRQARELFNHFATTLQPTFGVLHIPSTKELLQTTYDGLLEDEEPSAANLMLLFSIFAGASLVWTPRLLGTLQSTREEAKAAFKTYSRFAMEILEHPRLHIQASTTALVAIGTMAHILMNTDGFPLKVHLLRHRCLLMAREMQVHRLDTAKSREERRLKGCNMIDIEVQRRVWWNMVASDWLLAFHGSPHEGAYIFHPKHMNVNLPSNTDDEFITQTGIQQEFPLSVPTSMSAFLMRVKSASLSREVIDALPSILLGSTEPDYDTILELDAKFQNLLNELPVHFKTDPASIEQSREICKKRPTIAWQRISVHFSIHTRLCRLHRPYHLEGITNPRYAYSHKVCIQSAQSVLELRRSMDAIGIEVGLKAGQFLTVMHHVFFAALILAMDVSFNPSAPDAEDRKAKVLVAYQALEKSKQESNYLLEGIQKNLQTLMSTLQKDVRTTEDDQDSVLPPTGLGPSARVQPSSTEIMDGSVDGGTLINDLNGEGWEQLWSEFVAVAPELDAPQWSSLLEDVDFNPQLDIF